MREERAKDKSLGFNSATFLSTFCLLRMSGLGKLLSGTWN